MLFRSLCHPSSSLSKSPHAILTRKFTTDNLIRKLVVASPPAIRNPTIDYDSGEPIVNESDPRIDDPEAGRLFRRFRYLSAPVLKQSFYFIEQQHNLIIQGIILEQKHGSAAKHIQGASRIDQPRQDATPHLASAYGLDFAKLNSIVEIYMARANMQAGSYLIAMDEMDWTNFSRGKEREKTSTYMISKLQSVAWRVEYDFNGEKEAAFRKETENNMKAWIGNDKLKHLCDGSVWTRRTVRNLGKWKKVREALVRLMMRRSIKGKH